MHQSNETPRYRPSQLPELLKISLNGVYRLIAEGEIETIDITTDPNASRKRYAISQRAVDDFLARRTRRRTVASPRRSSSASHAATSFIK